MESGITRERIASRLVGPGNGWNPDYLGPGTDGIQISWAWERMASGWVGNWNGWNPDYLGPGSDGIRVSWARELMASG